LTREDHQGAFHDLYSKGLGSKKKTQSRSI
jgi:hypothetical protein